MPDECHCDMAARNWCALGIRILTIRDEWTSFAGPVRWLCPTMCCTQKATFGDGIHSRGIWKRGK